MTNTTFALEDGDVYAVEALSELWQRSKSDTVRQIIRRAATDNGVPTLPPAPAPAAPIVTVTYSLPQE